MIHIFMLIEVCWYKYWVKKKKGVQQKNGVENTAKCSIRGVFSFSCNSLEIINSLNIWCITNDLIIICGQKYYGLRSTS